MTSPKRILLVEDNERFSQAAFKFFSTTNVDYSHAQDYDEAIAELKSAGLAGFDGAMIDCFFPKALGLIEPDLTLGNQALEKMLGNDTRRKRADIYEKAFEEYLDLSDPELRRLARCIGAGSDHDNPEEYVVFRAIQQVRRTLGKEACSLLQKHNCNTIFRKDLSEFKDYYSELKAAMQRDHANQALGILVAEECENRGIPKVLATSTHHHDALTQPIQDYAGKRGWHLVDCSPGYPDEKAQASFWQRTYETLIGEIGGGR